MDDAEELLTEFMQWQAEKKVSGNDLSPQAFLIDRAKTQALDTLIRIDAEINAWEELEDYAVEDLIENIRDAVKGQQ